MELSGIEWSGIGWNEKKWSGMGCISPSEVMAEMVPARA